MWRLSRIILFDPFRNMLIIYCCYLLRHSTLNRCLCGGKCKVGNLANAREFRCCREIAQASRILTFDGSVERISCMSEHTDYAAMTNREVSKLVAPLLRDKDGNTYRCRGNQSENE